MVDPRYAAYGSAAKLADAEMNHQHGSLVADGLTARALLGLTRPHASMSMVAANRAGLKASDSESIHAFLTDPDLRGVSY